MGNVRVRWFEFGIGVWIMISPWILGFSNIFLAKWSNVLFGLGVALINVWDIFETKTIERSEEVKKKK